jgi:hypothetical protein
MSDATRRTVLLRYLRDTLKGDRAMLIAKSKLTKGRITQLLDPNEPFGEKAGRSLALKLGLPGDYFDRSEPRHGTAMKETPHLGLPDDQRRLLRLWEPLFEDEKQAFLEQLEVAHGNALKRIEEIRRRGLDKYVPDGEVPGAFTRPAQRDLPIDLPATARTGSGKKGKK